MSYLKIGNSFSGQNYCSKANLCSRNAYCINLVGSYSCQCKSGFVGSGKHCRTGPVIFNITYKETTYAFTEDLSDPNSFNYRYRSDGVSLFFEYVFANSPLSDVFVGAQVQAFRKGSVVIETLQVFDFDVDGRPPTAEDIKNLVLSHVDELLTVKGKMI